MLFNYTLINIKPYQLENDPSFPQNCKYRNEKLSQWIQPRFVIRLVFYHCLMVHSLLELSVVLEICGHATQGLPTLLDHAVNLIHECLLAVCVHDLVTLYFHICKFKFRRPQRPLLLLRLPIR